jgi:hypothetical protein
MTKPRSHATLASGAAALSLLLASTTAQAQATPLPESIPVGAWTFRPSVELRLRGEYRHALFEAGGVLFAQSGVFGDAPGSNLPQQVPTTFQPAAIENAWALVERARIGLAVDRGPVTAALVLQDSRAIEASPGIVALGEGRLPPGIGLFEAYFDAHAKNRRVWFRLGRQRVVWGDGRLLGESNFTQNPRALNAARFGFSAKNIDVDVLGALISPSFTGLGAPGAGATTGGAAEASPIVASMGSQLYGVHAVWHALPLLHPELAAIARVVRPPTGFLLTPSDTFVIDARLSGERRGFRYAIEGAYELGRISSSGDNRDVRAFAGAARATWETALPGHLTFGAGGSYASGDNGNTDPLSTQTRFDPILPEERPMHGRMGLYGWSNSIEAGGDIAARPIEALSLDVGYRFVGLAEPKGRWSTASLLAVGSSATNTSRVLGHQIDATVGVRVWDPLAIEAGYGLFLTGEGGKNILDAVGRGRPGAQHYGYLQATLRAP